MRSRKKMIAGNWKMNMTAEGALALIPAIAAGDAADVLICPPFTLLHLAAQEAARAGVLLGAQDVSRYPMGAHTGDISAEQLRDAGCQWVILGHSERRIDHDESSAEVCHKAEAAIKAGLQIIICVGETLRERELDQQNVVVEKQVLDSMPDNADARNCVFAYEPVWAIGTGQTATAEQAQAMHKFIRSVIADELTPQAADYMRILYGGSMKPDNAAELLGQPDIDGGLIGGAALKADQFNAIIAAVK
ncbi:triosephosphate isomerase [Alphaproteobacteria bacterium]|nr:triosephosphate isomerase [Alphaproteobacteria bacterium]